jgi:6-phosphogluconolactonase
MNTRVLRLLMFLLIAGCGGGGSNNAPSGPPARFLYVNGSGGPNTFPTYTFPFAIYANGAVGSLGGSFFEYQTWGGGPFVITRDAKYLYAADGLALQAFQLHSDGSATPAPTSSSGVSSIALGITADPVADFLYVTCDNGVLVLTLDPATGALVQTSSATLNDPNLRFGGSATLTPDGRYLYQPYYSQAPTQSTGVLKIAVFAVDPQTGALSIASVTSIATATAPQGYGEYGSILPGPAVDPTGRFLYIGYQVDASSGTQENVAAYLIDATTGALTSVAGSPFALNGSPVSSAIDASGKFLIVGTSPGAADSCLAVYAINPSTGALASLLPPSFSPCMYVVADPVLPFIYSGGGSNVFTLSLAPDGTLTSVGVAALPNQGELLGVSYLGATP